MKDDISKSTSNSTTGHDPLAHRHRYYSFQTKQLFEPAAKTPEGEQLFRSVEYNYLACNCTKTIKVLISKEVEA